MKKKITILLLFLLLFSLNLKSYSKENVFITHKINAEIITNIDIENEAKYLLALNNQLKNLSKIKILKIATDSIIKETIKKNEVNKYYTLDQKNSFLDTVIKDFYTKLNLTSVGEFEKYLSDYDLTIKDIKKKIEIETTWNQLIFTKFKNQINIDNEKLKKRVGYKNTTENRKLFLLSEIVFEKDKVKTVGEIRKKIDESIYEIGFKNTANIYSISDSAKFGGDIGWIEEEKLSNKLSKEIQGLIIGDMTKPINIGNGFLILKIEDIKNKKIKIDKKKELEKMILFEQNRQMEQFSKIYFNKIKINTIISAL